jgi:hypothetical protein
MNARGMKAYGPSAYALHAYARNLNVILKDLVTEMESLDEEIRRLQQTLQETDYYNTPEADRRVRDRRGRPRPGVWDRRIPVIKRRMRLQAQLMTAAERHAVRALQRRIVEANRF